MLENHPCVLSKKDFVSDQSVKWCPGCGDYAILNAVQNTLPKLNKKKEDIVFISGIGCSSRFPYYMSTYGFHTIHGRASAIATGVKLANPNLSVWEVTGDGDALAIGGNHFIHLIRRNIDINVLLFNNRIYGLTKGQSSPTTELGLVTKSSPHGTIERPFSPGELAVGAGASFFARVSDAVPAQMAEVFLIAAKHKGTSLIEILQNCVIFNDGIHNQVTAKENRDENQIYLEHGKPMLFGKNKNKGIALNGLNLEVINLDENGIDRVLIHNAHQKDPTLHNLLIRMGLPEFPIAMGVIRDVTSDTFDNSFSEQIHKEKTKSKLTNLNDFLLSGEVWKI